MKNWVDPIMSDSSEQSSSPNSDCNSQMGMVHRSLSTIGTYCNSAMTGLTITHHSQNLTPTSTGSPRYPQELCNAVTNLANSGSISLGANNNGTFSEEQIICLCKSMVQKKDMANLER